MQSFNFPKHLTEIKLLPDAHFYISWMNQESQVNQRPPDFFRLQTQALLRSGPEGTKGGLELLQGFFLKHNFPELWM